MSQPERILILADACVSVHISSEHAQTVGQDDKLWSEVQSFLDDQVKEVAEKVRQGWPSQPFVVLP